MFKEEYGDAILIHRKRQYWRYRPPIKAWGICIAPADSIGWMSVDEQKNESRRQIMPPDLSRPATAGRPDETDWAGEGEEKTLLDGDPQIGRSWVARCCGP
jgi:hypothetical protein